MCSQKSKYIYSHSDHIGCQLQSVLPSCSTHIILGWLLSYAKTSQFSIADFYLQIYIDRPNLLSAYSLREHSLPLSSATATAAFNIHSIFGLMPTLRAEVIWIFSTMTNHLLYRSSVVFNVPRSGVSAGVFMWRDKTTCCIR